MITHLAIEGVRALRSVSFDLPPLVALCGPNGSGLRSIIDAVELLARLADHDITSALARAGGAESLFHTTPEAQPVERLRLAVEMLVEPSVQDDWGTHAEVRYTRMRYEVEIVREEGTTSGTRYRVDREFLAPIQRTDDPWSRRYIRGGRERWLPTLRTGRTAPFISTGVEGGVQTLYLHQDGRGGIMAGVAQGAERTVLCSVATVEFPHAYAAREEMRRWRRFSLTAEGVAQSAPTLTRRVESNGANLPAALLRATWESGEMPERTAALARVSVPALEGITLREQQRGELPDLLLRLTDGTVISYLHAPEHLQRAIVLAALAVDIDGPSAALIECPENGLDPWHARAIVRQISAGVSQLDEEDQRPLRQAIVATHSPVIAEEIAKLHRHNEDAVQHDLPQLLAVLPSSNGSSVQHIRPSSQLHLPFDNPADSRTITLQELADTLHGRTGSPLYRNAWTQ